MEKINKRFERDYKDICYFIDHVRDVDYRVDLIRSLGYRIGVNVVRDDTDVEKKITIGKKKEYRVQIAPRDKRIPIAQCAIIE